MDQGSPRPIRTGFIYVLVRFVVHGLALAYLIWGPLQFGLRMALYVAFFMIYAGLASGTRLGKWL